MPIFNVFEKGLRRGAEHLPHDPSKAYAYVEHPNEGWRVYLRNAAFLHTKPLHIDQFLVFRNSKNKDKKNIWEPPKGQMEGKDILHHPKTPLLTLMTNALKREVDEEAHVTRIEEIRYTGLVFQSQEDSYPPNVFFQYHIFQFIISPKTLEKVFDDFKWIEEHPKAFARFKRDRKETDRVAWFNARQTPLNPRWCPTIVYAYLKEYDQQEVQLVTKS
jgi:hypothetical protein